MGGDFYHYNYAWLFYKPKTYRYIKANVKLNHYLFQVKLFFI